MSNLNNATGLYYDPTLSVENTSNSNLKIFLSSTLDVFDKDHPIQIEKITVFYDKFTDSMNNIIIKHGELQQDNTIQTLSTIVINNIEGLRALNNLMQQEKFPWGEILEFNNQNKISADSSIKPIKDKFEDFIQHKQSEFELSKYNSWSWSTVKFSYNCFKFMKNMVQKKDPETEKDPINIKDSEFKLKDLIIDFMTELTSIQFIPALILIIPTTILGSLSLIGLECAIFADAVLYPKRIYDRRQNNFELNNLSNEIVDSLSNFTAKINRSAEELQLDVEGGEVTTYHRARLNQQQQAPHNSRNLD